ncbi:MAG: nuclear transport factor 2 family protein, partial [Pseudomonadota bacterium]
MTPRIIAALGAALVLSPAMPAAAQDLSPAQVDDLAREVSRVESVRAVSDLQRFYAHYAQFGLWDEMAALFASNGAINWGDRTITGQRDIARFLRQRQGGVRGMAPGALNAELIEDPLINLAVDGQTAAGRWMFLNLA